MPPKSHARHVLGGTVPVGCYRLRTAAGIARQSVSGSDAAEHAPVPGAYLLIGDEPPADRIHYFHIPSPVYTLPIGRDNPDTNWHYQKLANETGGKMLHLELK